MSESDKLKVLQDKINETPDFIESLAERINDKMYVMIFSSYRKLVPDGEMSDEEYKLIEKLVLQELS